MCKAQICCEHDLLPSFVHFANENMNVPKKIHIFIAITLYNTAPIYKRCTTCAFRVYEVDVISHSRIVVIEQKRIEKEENCSNDAYTQ